MGNSIIFLEFLVFKLGGAKLKWVLGFKITYLSSIEPRAFLVKEFFTHNHETWFSTAFIIGLLNCFTVSILGRHMDRHGPKLL